MGLPLGRDRLPQAPDLDRQPSHKRRVKRHQHDVDRDRYASVRLPLHDGTDQVGGRAAGVGKLCSGLGQRVNPLVLGHVALKRGDVHFARFQ